MSREPAKAWLIYATRDLRFLARIEVRHGNTSGARVYSEGGMKRLPVPP